jgi:hypothetical protein
MAAVVFRGATALTLWAASSLVAAAWERLHNERISGASGCLACAQHAAC